MNKKLTEKISNLIDAMIVGLIAIVLSLWWGFGLLITNEYFRTVFGFENTASCSILIGLLFWVLTYLSLQKENKNGTEP